MASDCDFGDRSTGEVTLLVASRSADVLLLSGQRPLLHDLRVARFASTFPPPGQYRLASLASKLREISKM
jgi:hypothetical protein